LHIACSRPCCIYSVLLFQLANRFKRTCFRCFRCTFTSDGKSCSIFGRKQRNQLNIKGGNYEFKKVLVNSFVVCSVTSALLATGFSANASTITQSVTLSDFYSYIEKYENEISTMRTYTDMTSLTASNSDYNGAYKWVRYAVYGQSSGSYYSIYSSENNGTAKTVLTNPRTITTDVVRRIHKAQLHYSSNSSSTVMDDFDVRLNKF